MVFRPVMGESAAQFAAFWMGASPTVARVMAVVVFSIPAVLRERDSFEPNDTAFTFIDYEHDWEGVPESLTWSQLYRRTLNLAQQLRLCASTGDRAVILAPQGLEYVISS